MGITISRESITATHAVIERYLLVPLAPGERVGVVISGGNTTAVDFGGSADSSPGSGARARGMRAGGPRRVS